MIRFSGRVAYFDTSKEGAYSIQGAYSGQAVYLVFCETTKCSKQNFNKH